MSKTNYTFDGGPMIEVPTIAVIVAEMEQFFEDVYAEFDYGTDDVLIGAAVYRTLRSKIGDLLAAYAGLVASIEYALSEAKEPAIARRHGASNTTVEAHGYLGHPSDRIDTFESELVGDGQRCDLEEMLKVLTSSIHETLEVQNAAIEEVSRWLEACGCCCEREAPPNVDQASAPTDPLSPPTAKGFFSANASGADKLNDAIAKGKELGQVITEIEASTTARLTPAMDNLGQTMTNVFADAARDGKISADEIGKAFLDMAMKIMQQQVFSKMGPFGQIAGALFGGLIGGGKAGGGTVQPNMPVLVGERGPEVFVPSMPGRVANNSDSRRNFGGARNVTINQTIMIEPTTQKDLVAMLQAYRPAFREDAKRAVFEAMNHIRY